MRGIYNSSQGICSNKGKQMKIKVCGMKDTKNIEALVKVKPDYIGFIFYPHSKRFIGFSDPSMPISLIPKEILRVGVFVNEKPDTICKIKEQCRLDYVQLHGEEDPAYCQKIKASGLSIIKAFGIRSSSDFDAALTYESCCDFFLFDTASTIYGGSGKKFEWTFLESYKLKVPFFLSGGISLQDASLIKKIQHPYMHAIDINSRFETSPGIKDILKIEQFIQTVRQ
jgi:phosphoribosylanthranilate isomerase